jgi:anti-sigma factor (TIGR02949 family)
MKSDKKRDINCREALKMISAYLDREDDQADHQALERHLESCQHCFDRVEFEKLLKNRLRGLKVDVSSMNLSPEAKRILKGL